MLLFASDWLKTKQVGEQWTKKEMTDSLVKCSKHFKLY